MNTYEIISVDPDEAIIIATSFMNPLNDLPDIEKELRDKYFQGDVIFDLALCNGLSSNRWSRMYFSGLIFERESFSVVDEVENVVSLVCAFGLTSENLIDNGILCEYEITTIKEQAKP